MSFLIESRGYMEYMKPVNDEDWTHVDAGELVQGHHRRIAGQQTKDDAEEWVVPFSVSTKHGRFEWQVFYSLDLSGATIDGSSLDAPEGVEYRDQISFVVNSGD